MPFWKRFETEFEKMFEEVPKWEETAISVVNIAAPVAMGALTFVEPALLPVAAPIIAEVKVGLATLKVMSGDGTDPVTVAGVVSGLQKNLSAFLDLIHVKDATKRTDIEAALATVAPQISNLAGKLPAPDPAGVIAALAKSAAQNDPPVAESAPTPPDTIPATFQ